MAANAQVAAFHEKAYERLLDELNSKDDLAVRLGDTLDVKASILLAVIALLATQTAYFLDKGVSGLPHYLLVSAAGLLGLATLASFAELWPRHCQLPVPESSGIARAGELRDFYSQHEGIESSVMLSEFTKDEIGWAQFRISKNEAINDQKSRCLEISFSLTAGAMTLDASDASLCAFFERLARRLRGRRRGRRRVISCRNALGLRITLRTRIRPLWRIGHLLLPFQRAFAAKAAICERFRLLSFLALA